MREEDLPPPLNWEQRRESHDWADAVGIEDASQASGGLTWSLGAHVCQEGVSAQWGVLMVTKQCKITEEGATLALCTPPGCGWGTLVWWVLPESTSTWRNWPFGGMDNHKGLIAASWGTYRHYPHL